MPVIQTQLLPITILPIQTIPLQSLPPIQTPQGQVPASNNTPNTPTQHQIGPNQSQTPSKESAKGPNQTISSPGSSSTVANKQSQGKEAPAGQTETPYSNPTSPSPSSKGLSNPVTSQATAKATDGKKPPKTPNPKTQQNANSNSLTSRTTPSQ